MPLDTPLDEELNSLASNLEPTLTTPEASLPVTPESSEPDPLLIDESSPLPALPPPPAPNPEEEVSVIGDMLKGIPRGLEGAVRSVYNLADFVTADALPNWTKNFSGESQTTAGSVVENATQFLAGFIPVFGALGKVGAITTTVGRGLVAGAVTDFTVFDGTQDRLSNLVQTVPALQNPITEYLAQDGEESVLEGRLKNAIEGAGLGVVADTLVASVKGIAKARSLRAAGASAEEVNRALVEGLGDQPALERTLAAGKQGDEALPAVVADEVTPPTTPPAASASPEVPPAATVPTPPPAPTEINRLATDLYTGVARTDSTKHLNSTDDVVALAQSARKEAEKELGTRPIKSREAELSEMSKQLAAYSNRSELAIKTDLIASSKSIEEATTKALAAGRLLPALAKEAFAAVKQAALVGTDAALAEALAKQQRYVDFMRISEAFGTAQGRGMKARQYIKIETLKSAAAARKIVEEMGGSGNLLPDISRIAAAGSDEAASKLLSMQMSLGGRLLRAHNEGWMNAVLSGPKTSVVNTVGNTFTTLYLPFEGAIGSLFRGDVTASKAFLQHYVGLFEQFSESSKWAFQSFKTGSNILEGSGRFADETLGSNKIDAGFLSGNAELTSQGLKAEGKAAGKALLGAEDNLGAHLINFMGEVTRMPQRFLTGTDEFFKQLNYRSSARTKLYFEGRKLGKEGADLAAHIEDGIQSIVADGGRRFSEAAVYRRGIAQAEAQGLTGEAADTFVDAYVTKNFQPGESALDKFSLGVSKESTFQRDLEGLPKKINEAVQAHPLLQLVVPFVKTPTNLLKFVGQRSFPMVPHKVGNIPLPNINFLHKRAVAEFASADPLIRSQAMGRSAVGAALFAGAGMLALQGKITGKGPRDEAEKKALMATGWQPYSLKFGEGTDATYISYQRLDPLATFFGLVADMHEQIARQEDHMNAPVQAVMNSAIISLAANVTNKSYLAGIQQVTDALSNPERFGPRLIKNRIGSYVPNIVAQIRGDLDGDNALKEVRTYSDALLGRLPVFQGTLEPKRNILGESVDSALATTPLSAVNPFTRSPAKDDKVFAELARLQHGFKAPSPIYQGAIKLLEIKSEQGQTAYDRWLELHGQVKLGGRTLRQAMEKLIGSSYYNRLADQATADEFRSPRVAEVERVVGLYRRAAFTQLQREFPLVRDSIKAVRQDQLKLRRGQAATQLAALVDN